MLIGIIGKANVGKSTFFNAATDQSVPSANYPFTTVQPNIGISYVRKKCVCREFGVQDNPTQSMCIDGNRFIPVRLIDVAGLVPGAHIGKGLGNKFLDDARQADALIHIVDISGTTDSEGHIIDQSAGNPLFDIKFVEEEFDKWLFSIVNRDWNKISRDISSQKIRIEQVLTKRLSGLSISSENVSKCLIELNLKNKNPELWTQEEIFNFVTIVRKKSKPLIIVANKIDLLSSKKNLKIIQHETNHIIIPCASEAELVLRKGMKNGLWYYLPGDNKFEIKKHDFNEQQQRAISFIKDMLKEMGSTGVQDAINTICFDLMNLIVVYPVEDDLKLADKNGNVLPNSLLISKGSTARDLAEHIHADLAKGFMFAIDVRNKQRIGADYKLKDNDIIKIVSTTARG
jgi:ribosome-binding ATPase YchF (GTP1/OBG family)